MLYLFINTVFVYFTVCPKRREEKEIMGERERKIMREREKKDNGRKR